MKSQKYPPSQENKSAKVSVKRVFLESSHSAATAAIWSAMVTMLNHSTMAAPSGSIACYLKPCHFFKQMHLDFGVCV